ncbi:MAG: TaqI family restriction endonuclease [bacterium]
MNLEKFNKFLKTVDLVGYRKKYSSIKIVEMDLSKDNQAIELLYKVYWDEKKFISFDDFYKRYLKESRLILNTKCLPVYLILKRKRVNLDFLI